MHRPPLPGTGRPTSPTSGPQADVDAHPHRWAVLAVLAAVAFMAQLDLFIVNLAIPAMGTSFPGAGIGELSWVLNAYAVVFGALLVPAGRWADRRGRRMVLLAGVALFTVASVVCAAAPGLGVLVLGRILQAVGAAAIVPTSLSLLYPAFPVRLHATVVGIWAGVAAVAATAGPVAGGLLVALDWRWIFLVNVPIGVAVLLLGRRVLPTGRTDGPAPLPQLSSVLALLGAVSLVVLALVELERGWSTWSGALVVLALAAVATTVWSSARQPRPVVEPALFDSPGFLRSSLALVLFFVAFGAWLLLGVLFLQNAWGYSPWEAGLAFAPGPLAAAVLALCSGRIVGRHGPVLPAVAGPLFVAAAGVCWFVLATGSPNYLVGFLIGQVLGGIGSGLTQAPLFAATGALPAHRATGGSAFLNMCRQIGSAVGVALVVLVTATAMPTRIEEFRRGWLLVVVAALAAAATQIRRPNRPKAGTP